MTVSDLLEQPCNKSDNINQVRCYKLLTVCFKLVDNLGQAVRRQLVDDLLADLLQDVRFLRVYNNTKVIACLDVYQAALMRRRTRKQTSHGKTAFF